jgi:serine/threonine protein kinase/tetratricopeptide (TPR) repeat protein
MHGTVERVRPKINHFLRAYEQARASGGPVALADHLPESGNLLRTPVLRELIRFDLKLGRTRAGGRRLESYLAEFPELGDDREALAELAFVEYRLRRFANEDVTDEDYERRFGIDVVEWAYRLETDGPDLDAAEPVKAASFRATTALRPAAVEEAARSYLHYCAGSVADPDMVDAWCRRDGIDPGPAKVFRDLHRSDPSEAEKLARAVVEMPRPGTEFLGFRLIQELGRGAFGRVYLAHQADLADRPVALKVSAEMPGESKTLARLQHTNIVPIYSAHSVPPLHAVCMPFFGAATLADVYSLLESSDVLPDSGQALVATLSSKRKHVGSFASPSSSGSGTPPAADPSPAPTDDGAPSAEPATAASLQLLGDMPFVRAVLWLGSRLADGLTHAHERGILHRDLKPANILLTDDGQPMLLDFNLSEDTKQAGVASLGGTLPYMSPEHLEAFRGGTRPVDARSDLYSLGVILYEMLTGRHPFEEYKGSSLTVIGRMIEARNGPAPEIRSVNRKVTPAEESIVRHLLEADPARRYQAAKDLREDIDRHLANLPLRHAPEPSTAERARKWSRRHPRITSGTTIAPFVGALLIVLAALLFIRGQRIARFEAYETLAGFRQDFDSCQFLLNTQTDDPERREQGITTGRRAIGIYGALVDPRWREAAAVVNLDRDDRPRLAEDIGELALIVARAMAIGAADRPAGADRRSLVSSAMALCDLAASCYVADKPPRSLWVQRAELTALLGQEVEAKALRARAEQTPLRTPRDRYLAATELVVAGEFRKALPLARDATRENPRNIWSWFLLALCHDRLDQNAEAIACYGTCIALRPEFSFSWFNRGIVQMRADENEQARADFARVIELRPDWFEPYLNRGIVEMALKEDASAIRDFSRSLELGAPDTRVFFLRAQARDRSGDVEGARRDREEGLRREPTDEPSYIARGMARLSKDIPGALADFERAVKLNPRSIVALQDSVHCLGELNRDDDALALLERIIALYPDHAPSRSSRGVLLAIKGRRDEAHRNARESLWRDTSPRNLYQVAGIYATTSKANPEDRIEAFRLLSTALRGGFGFDYLPDDHELDAIRNQPEFLEILAAAKALIKGSAPPDVAKP